MQRYVWILCNGCCLLIWTIHQSQQHCYQLLESGLPNSPRTFLFRVALFALKCKSLPLGSFFFVAWRHYILPQLHALWLHFAHIAFLPRFLIWRGWGPCLTRQEVLNEAVILHFPYTKISDLSVGGEQCGCHYKPKDAEACFMNTFDHHVRFSRRIVLGNHYQASYASL